MGSSQSSQLHVEDGRRFAKKAEQLDHQACNTQNSELYTQAMNNYYSAVECIRKALEHEKEAKRREILKEKMELYLKRVELLKIWNPAGGKCGPPTKLEVVKSEKSGKPEKPKEGGDKTQHAMVPAQVEKAVEKPGTKDIEVFSDDTVDATAMVAQGFALGKKATEEDRNAVAAADPMLYEMAKRTYHSAIDHFRTALIHEKIPKMIDLIEDRIQEYLDRADILGTWAETKSKTKSAASSAVAAVKAEDKENSKTSSRSKKTEGVAVMKAPSAREDGKKRTDSSKKTNSVVAVSQSVRSKESSRAHKQDTKKTSNTKAPSSTTSKNRAGDAKDDKSRARSKQHNASTSMSKKGSSRAKEPIKAPKKSGTDGKESSRAKKTSTKRPKQTNANTKGAAPKTRVKCTCGARAKRKQSIASKK